MKIQSSALTLRIRSILAAALLTLEEMRGLVVEEEGCVGPLIADYSNLKASLLEAVPAGV
jgi:hypothetical protein